MISPDRTATYQPPSGARPAALAGVPLASFTRRAIALAIDFLSAGVAFLALLVGGGMLAVRLGLIAPERDISLRLTFFGNWYSVIWLVVYFALGTWLGNGQTPGKRLCGIRVVSLVHEHIGFWHSVERALGYGASALEAGFGFFQYFLRVDRRTVHDRIAETIVVAERPRASRPPVDADAASKSG
jgi:uncharacterized RDD family membrane protein YckC